MYKNKMKHTLRRGKKSSDLFETASLHFSVTMQIPHLSLSATSRGWKSFISFMLFFFFLPSSLLSYILTVNGHCEQPVLGALCMALQKKLPGK